MSAVNSDPAEMESVIIVRDMSGSELPFSVHGHLSTSRTLLR